MTRKDFEAHLAANLLAQNFKPEFISNGSTKCAEAAKRAAADIEASDPSFFHTEKSVQKRASSNPPRSLKHVKASS